MEKRHFILILTLTACRLFAQPALPATNQTLTPVANAYSASWVYYTTDSVSGLSFLNGASIPYVTATSNSIVTYINTATNGFITAAITNGLASTNFVLAQGYVTAAVTNGLVGANITNGLASISYVNAATNNFVSTLNSTVQSATNNFMATVTNIAQSVGGGISATTATNIANSIVQSATNNLLNITNVFISTNIAIPQMPPLNVSFVNNFNTTNLSHQVWLICIQNDSSSGYTTGDRIDATSLYDYGNIGSFFTFTCTATNFGFLAPDMYVQDSAFIYLPSKDGSTWFGITSLTNFAVQMIVAPIGGGGTVSLLTATNGMVGSAVTNTILALADAYGTAQSATNNFVGTVNNIVQSSTNGLATTNFVLSQGYVTSAITNGLVGAGITNGLASTSFVLAQGYVTAGITNGLVGTSITNGLASTNFVNTAVQNGTNNLLTTVNTLVQTATNNVLKTATNSFYLASNPSNYVRGYYSNKLVSTAFTVGASPANLTNTFGKSIEVFLWGGTLQSVSLNGGSLMTNVNTIGLQTNEYITVTYTNTIQAQWHPFP